jgi:hypothetical protein
MKLDQIEGELNVSEYLGICPWCNNTFIKSPPQKKFCCLEHKSKFNFKKNYVHKRGPRKLKGPDLFAA